MGGSHYDEALEGVADRWIAWVQRTAFSSTHSNPRLMMGALGGLWIASLHEPMDHRSTCDECMLDRVYVHCFMWKDLAQANDVPHDGAESFHCLVRYR